MKALRLIAPILAACTLAAPSLAPRLAAQTSAQNDSSVRANTRTNSLPLLTPRKLNFTTDEATWISLDVAPEGQTIVFDILGDLYTLPIAGGMATRITSGAGGTSSRVSRRMASASPSSAIATVQRTSGSPTPTAHARTR